MIPAGVRPWQAKSGAGIPVSRAESFLRANDRQTGLPHYLGFQVADFGPGRLVVSFDVRDEFARECVLPALRQETLPDLPALAERLVAKKRRK